MKVKMKTGQPFVSSVITSKVSGNSVVTVVMPVKKADKTVGVIGGVVLVKNLGAKVDAMKYGETGYAYMVQSDGFMIAHPKKDFVLKFNVFTEETAKGALRDTIQKAFTEKKLAVAEYDFLGVDKLVAIKSVPGTPYAIAVTDDKDDIYRGITAQRNIILVVTLVAILLSAVVIYFVVRELAVKKIKALVDVANVLAKGDYSKSISSSLMRGTDEFSTLASAFNNMKNSVSAMMREIIETAKDMSYTANEFTDISGQAAIASESVAHTVVNVTSSMDRASTMVSEAGAAVEQMTDLLSISRGDSEELAILAQKANESSDKGANVIEQAMDKMQAVNGETEKVEKAMHKLGRV